MKHLPMPIDLPGWSGPKRSANLTMAISLIGNGHLTNWGEKFVAGMATASAQAALRLAFPEGMAITLAHVIAQAARLSV